MKYLKDKNILIISPESWGLSFLSKHHYALLLAELGNNVWFLNAPHSPSLDLSMDITERTFGRLHLLSDSTQKGIRFLPEFFQKIFTKWSIRKLEEKAGVKWDLIWSFDNSRLFHLDCFNGFKIHHVVDLPMNFHLKEASSSADLCLGVTTEIVHNLTKFNSNSHLVKHGWRLPMKTVSEEPLSTQRPRAAYMGNLLMKAFDANLFLELVNDYPNCDFILIGSETTNHLTRFADPERLAILKELKQCSNVRFVGELTYDAAFSLINVCDILLLMYFNFDRPFDNSSKLMSYLSTGKVVISNPVSEYQETNLLCIADSRKSFLKLFGEVLCNLDFWNSEEKSIKRKSYAEQFSYSNLIAQIDDLITLTSKK